MKKIFAINGFANLGGQERLVNEILMELDDQIEPDIIEIVVPVESKIKSKYNNIKVIRYGKGNKIIWVQFYFLMYLIKNKRIGINLFNSCPIIKPDIMTIYDMTLELQKKEICHSFRGRLSYIYGKMMRFCAMHGSKLIFTMTNTSKKEICEYYKNNGKKIKVFNAGWQHMLRIERDDRIFEKFPLLKRKEYFLSLSSLAPHKNFKWIVEVAKRNERAFFAIAGNSIGYGNDFGDVKNLIYLGRITDGEMKSLMAECKAFIHPAYSEGFGIPPLEALSQGAQIIVSNTSCLPEVYEKSAHYINPDDYEVDLDALLSKPVESADKILNKYSWKNVAENFYKNIKDLYL